MMKFTFLPKRSTSFIATHVPNSWIIPITIADFGDIFDPVSSNIFDTYPLMAIVPLHVLSTIRTMLIIIVLDTSPDVTLDQLDLLLVSMVVLKLPSELFNLLISNSSSLRSLSVSDKFS